MSEGKHTIMIIDDHPLIHDGIKTLLSAEDKLEVTVTAFSASEAMKKLKENLPDLAIIDLSLDDSDGTYLVQRIKQKYERLKVLVYTMSEEKLFAERTAIAGADGYVMKTASPNVLKKAMFAVLDGEFFFSDDIKKRMKKRRDGRTQGPTTLIDTLSNREMDIFKLIGLGLDTVQIGKKLKISRNTVDTHRINIKNKLELSNGKALDRFAFEVIQQGKLPKK